MSGVAQADAAGLGAIEVREMKRYGFTPVFLIGGILTGYATPTQLCALTAVYAVVMGFIMRELSFGGLAVY